MPSNTNYKPKSVLDFEASKLNANYMGLSGTCVAGQMTNIDYTFTDDHLITGVEVIAENSTFGDTITLQVLAPVPDGLGGFNYVVANQFATNWGVGGTNQQKINRSVPYPAKLFAGLVLRVIYTSTGQSDVKVLVNLELHKVLE